MGEGGLYKDFDIACRDATGEVTFWFIPARPNPWADPVPLPMPSPQGRDTVWEPGTASLFALETELVAPDERYRGDGLDPLLPYESSYCDDAWRDLRGYVFEDHSRRMSLAGRAPADFLADSSSVRPVFSYVVP